MPLVEEERETRVAPGNGKTGLREEEPRVREERPERMEEVAAGGGSIAGVLGIATIILAIIGLVGVLRGFLTPIATIVFGVALLLEGSALATQFAGLAYRLGRGRMDVPQFGGGMTLPLLAGVGGIVLGILALLGLHAVALVSIATIAFGGALFLGTASSARIHSLAVEQTTDQPTLRAMALEAVSAFAGLKVLLGVAGIVLGILALVRFPGWPLNLVALLIFGFSALISGSAMATRMVSLIRH